MKRFARMVVLVMSLSLALAQMSFAQQGQMPPGVKKRPQVPGKGSHKGWEQGKHKGWDKKKTADEQAEHSKKKEGQAIEEEQKGEDTLMNAEKAATQEERGEKSHKKDKPKPQMKKEQHGKKGNK